MSCQPEFYFRKPDEPRGEWCGIHQQWGDHKTIDCPTRRPEDRGRGFNDPATAEYQDDRAKLGLAVKGEE